VECFHLQQAEPFGELTEKHTIFADHVIMKYQQMTLSGDC